VGETLFRFEHAQEISPASLCQRLGRQLDPCGMKFCDHAVGSGVFANDKDLSLRRR
jgi:hypothetical protein